jgi:hypothetical protein
MSTCPRTLDKPARRGAKRVASGDRAAVSLPGGGPATYSTAKSATTGMQSSTKQDITAGLCYWHCCSGVHGQCLVCMRRRHLPGAVRGQHMILSADNEAHTEV